MHVGLLTTLMFVGCLTKCLVCTLGGQTKYRVCTLGGLTKYRVCTFEGLTKYRVCTLDGLTKYRLYTWWSNKVYSLYTLGGGGRQNYRFYICGVPKCIICTLGLWPSISLYTWDMTNCTVCTLGVWQCVLFVHLHCPLYYSTWIVFQYWMVGGGRIW